MNKRLKQFYALWATQGLSQLGSSCTAFALTLWLYEKTGLALNTSLLTICTYAPYVLVSVFAGALTDRFDKKKSMLICDLGAAICTIIILVLYKTNLLMAWHLYVINIISGLMNSIQQPASEVALTLLVDKQDYQEAGALKNLSRSVVSILNPLIATALYGIKGLDLVIALDLTTFSIAFICLSFFIKIPKCESEIEENILVLAKGGIDFLRKTPLVFTIILFMSGVNFIASAFDAALPAYVLPNPKGGSEVLGVVSSCSGVAMVVGSIVAGKLPKPKDRVKVVYLTMFFSLGTENFLLAFSRNPIIWCIGQVFGWFVVPIMSTSLEIVLRNNIPLELQGRVYACRNTFQYALIPAGLFFGGFMVDNVCEPFMAHNINNTFLTTLFGYGKGSGAGLFIFIMGIIGCVFCILAGKKLNKYHFVED